MNARRRMQQSLHRTKQIQLCGKTSEKHASNQSVCVSQGENALEEWGGQEVSKRKSPESAAAGKRAAKNVAEVEAERRSGGMRCRRRLGRSQRTSIVAWLVGPERLAKRNVASRH